MSNDSPIQIAIDDQDVLTLLAGLEARAGDMAPVMGEVAEAMLGAVEDNFEAQGRPAWEDLAKSTQRTRARLGHWPGPILQISGQLASSIQADHDALSASVGTNKVYAAIHQFGGTITHPARSALVRHRLDAGGGFMGFARRHHKRVREIFAVVPQYEVTIPARPFLALTTEDTRDIADILLRHLAP